MKALVGIALALLIVAWLVLDERDARRNNERLLRCAEKRRGAN